MNFKNWEDYKNKNVELNLNIYCKQHLKEMKLKPNKDAEPQVHQVYSGGRWTKFNFYHIQDTQHIKAKKPIVVKELELTTDNIYRSLYVINKSAKKSRDSKKINYNKGQYGVVSRCKTREKDLYSLKNSAIDKLIQERKLVAVGYHTQEGFGKDTCLVLYKGIESRFSFHVMADKNSILNLENLGNIDTISSESSKTIGIKFNEAVGLLSKYIKSN